MSRVPIAPKIARVLRNTLTAPALAYPHALGVAVYTAVWTTRPTDKRMKARTDVRTKGRTDIRTNRQLDKQTIGQIDNRTEGWTDKRMEGWTENGTEGWTDGLTDRQSYGGRTAYGTDRRDRLSQRCDDTLLKNAMMMLGCLSTVQIAIRFLTEQKK